MVNGRRLVGRAALLGGAVSVLIVACAQGNTIETTPSGGAGGSTPTTASTGGTSASTGGTDGGGGPNGQIGSPCLDDADCVVGTCTQIGTGKYCSQACPPECPDGTYCSLVAGESKCVPDLGQLCGKCTAATDCALPTDTCLTAPPGDKFCAIDCSTDGLCPNGFTCMDKPTYEGGGSMDGGVPDAGDAGKPPAGMPYKWCVPSGGASCPCTEKRDGVVHDCSVTNNFGSCSGTEKCNGQTKKFEGCTAATPAAESCDSKDNDCNGKVDDGDPNALCSSQGPKPPHASWACKVGTCSLGACDPGWTAYPPGAPSDGCACPIEVGEPNGTCGAATDVGNVSDTGAPIVLQGTLSSASDVDVWTFHTVDVNEGNTNSYHVNITFTAPSPNDEFVMDVIRGGPCSDAPAGPSTSITTYDWCVNATDGNGTGELSCGPTAAVHCEDHSSQYWVRVYRKLGVTGTCTLYTINVSAGGGACDLAAKCP